MANWIANLSIFGGAITFGWFATQFLDWLLQTPMVPSDEPDPRRADPKRLEELTGRIEKIAQDIKSGQMRPTIPNRQVLTRAWGRTEGPLASVQSIAHWLREQDYPGLAVDRKAKAAEILADIQVPMTILASSGPPSDPMDRERALAQWMVVTFDLRAVDGRLAAFLEALPENNLFKIRGLELYGELGKIRDVGEELVKGR